LCTASAGFAPTSAWECTPHSLAGAGGAARSRSLPAIAFTLSSAQFLRHVPSSWAAGSVVRPYESTAVTECQIGLFSRNPNNDEAPQNVRCKLLNLTFDISPSARAVLMTVEPMWLLPHSLSTLSKKCFLERVCARLSWPPILPCPCGMLFGGS
jgi:hypothetical protein